ncbi:MAG: DDE-type integrase/transposase/recombinase [Spiroplasma phoeniceum]|nr:MAG: DDE-type integrase/transposase/recombinase [Spiroplasma phoeniceum]
MNKNNIQIEYVKRMRKKILIKKAKNKNIIKYTDLENRKFNKIKEKIKVLFTDVTYLIWNGKKHYQSTIIDGYTKEIVDVQWSKYNDNKIVVKNLDAAINKIKQKKYISNIIIHSDHGFQYKSKIYNNKCISNEIRISMDKNYHCANNIVIESFHSLLKKATIHNNIYLYHDE